MDNEELEVDYEVVSEFAGNKSNKKVKVTKAAEDIFNLVKTKAMQATMKGTFIEFDNIDDPQDRLEAAAISGTLS